MRILRLAQTITNPTTAIFSYLQSFDVPWKGDNINTFLDTDYFYNQSGQKIISPMVKMLLDESGELDATAFGILANVLYSRFGLRWSKIWATFVAEYNPINNYDMIERMTNDKRETTYGHVLTREDDLSSEQSGSESTTNTIDETDVNSVKGFNSSNWSESEKQKRDGENGIETETGNTITNTGTQTNTESGKDIETRNYLLTRSGNIGVTTTQQMLESERQLWQYDYFKSVVYADLDKVLTIATYD